MLTVAQCASLACLLEVTVPKPGNVHRGADFEDTSFTDFVCSAVAIEPAMAAARSQRVGLTIRTAIEATRNLTSSNTNLGIVLLLAPLAAVKRPEHREAELANVLSGMGPEDAADVYAAICLAQPGGLGKREQMDVRDDPPSSLLDAMALASENDLIARQYVSNFQLVLHEVAPRIAASVPKWGLYLGVIDTFLWILSIYRDSLIQRKCGDAIADQVRARAAAVRSAGGPETEAHAKSLSEFDFWLRQDGNRRNPGTAADLIAAGLFVCLQDHQISREFWDCKKRTN